MIIRLSPVRRDDDLTVAKRGDTLVINGIELDFSQLPEGATLPAEAIACPWIAGQVERVDGELRLSLILPHGPNPSQAVAFPEPIEVTTDGPVELPQ